MIQILLYACACVGTVIWFYNAPSYEPVITGLLAFSSLISAIWAKQKIDHLSSQVQKIAKGGSGMQAGRDIILNKEN